MRFIKWADAPAGALVWHVELEGQHTACGLSTPSTDDVVYRIRRHDGSILKVCCRCKQAQVSQ